MVSAGGRFEKSPTAEKAPEAVPPMVSAGGRSGEVSAAQFHIYQPPSSLRGWPDDHDTEAALRHLGLLDFARLQLPDGIPRHDLVSDLVASYHRENCRGHAYLWGVRVSVDRKSFLSAAALQATAEHKVLPPRRRTRSTRSSSTVTSAALQFMEIWILPQFQGRDMLPSIVSAAMREVKAELAHNVDWGELIWDLVQNEILELPKRDDKNSYFGLHLLRLVWVNHPEVFGLKDRMEILARVQLDRILPQVVDNVTERIRLEFTRPKKITRFFRVQQPQVVNNLSKPVESGDEAAAVVQVQQQSMVGDEAAAAVQVQVQQQSMVGDEAAAVVQVQQQSMVGDEAAAAVQVQVQQQSMVGDEAAAVVQVQQQSMVGDEAAAAVQVQVQQQSMVGDEAAAVVQVQQQSMVGDEAAAVVQVQQQSMVVQSSPLTIVLNNDASVGKRNSLEAALAEPRHADTHKHGVKHVKQQFQQGNQQNQTCNSNKCSVPSGFIVLNDYARDSMEAALVEPGQADAHKHGVRHVKQQFQQGNRQKWTRKRSKRSVPSGSRISSANSSCDVIGIKSEFKHARLENQPPKELLEAEMFIQAIKVLNETLSAETIVHILQDSPPSGSPLKLSGAVVEVTK
ncbi:uncharacterized protein LOC125521444 isoform X1 [Triticum urartu]|uniref:uncharacterized protein LOC125521444 isoform X1 n=1 Tax=Triticum urartu TaxID=4572 RepID=UPI002044103F|nr:uncharacterized protein LOC125521444 isoform X1 [Triticum urartu]